MNDGLRGNSLFATDSHMFSDVDLLRLGDGQDFGDSHVVLNRFGLGVRLGQHSCAAFDDGSVGLNWVGHGGVHVFGHVDGGHIASVHRLGLGDVGLDDLGAGPGDCFRLPVNCLGLCNRVVLCNVHVVCLLVGDSGVRASDGHVAAVTLLAGDDGGGVVLGLIICARA